MRKHLFVLAFFCLVVKTLSAQITNSVIYITKTYSPNKEFFIQCIPYDEEEPSLRGIAKVYNKRGNLVYTINRNFNGVRENGNYLTISNDGTIVTYVIVSGADEYSKELKSLSIYKNGKLVKGFTQKDITGCEPQNDRCQLVYNNYDRIVDLKRSQWGTENYHKVFKENVDRKEIFLNEHAIMVYKDHLYIVDPRKVVHVIGLKKAVLEPVRSFEQYYALFKNTAKDNLTSYKRYDTPHAPFPSAFPNLLNGDTTGLTLAKYIHRKADSLNTADYNRYKRYQITINAYIFRNGDIQIEKLEADKPLPLDSITTFFKSHKYDVSFLPKELDRWHFQYFFWGFRDTSAAKARIDKLQEEIDRELKREKRMTQDTIDGVYIPKNLQECFTDLDKNLANIEKKEMKALKNRGDMIRYHLTLGMWIRNRYGLWGGSRLLKYFQDRSLGKWPGGPEEASTVILFTYYDWLKGDKDAALKWEQANPIQSK